MNDLDKYVVLKKWLEIEFYYMAKRLGFIDNAICPNQSLILTTIRIIDYETTMPAEKDTNTVIALLSLMWEHIDKSKYDIKDFLIKIFSRIGYPTSAIISDNGYDPRVCQFSSINSILDRVSLSLLQSENEISVGDTRFLLTQFQKKLWNSLDSYRLIGISAPTSAGKSFAIMLKTIDKMLSKPLDVIYIVPTLSLLNQVVEDYNDLLQKAGVDDYIITNNLPIGQSKAAHTIYVWTQEKAIAVLSSDEFDGMPKGTILVVDEIQNIERISEDNDVRAKILYDTLQELRHSKNIEQIIISGPRIMHISELGLSLFGDESIGVETNRSPVLSLTYSIKRKGQHYYLKQYCGLVNEAFEKRIVNDTQISGYGISTVTDEYLMYLADLSLALRDDQNIIFAPTSSTARIIAVSLAQAIQLSVDSKINELIKYYSESVHPGYTMCQTLNSGVAYHHGKLPIHVRRTIERAIKEKMISNIVCTTTLMQGVNLPAQNIIIRNPHLYTRRHTDAAELTNYEMANLRGRAGRLLKDYIGRTIVLDESEFEEAEGYDQQTLFDDVEKDVSSGYGSQFEIYKENVIDAVESTQFVGNEMAGYGYLVTYIRQSVLRYGKEAQGRMAETGVVLDPKQVAAIIMKLKSLSVPRQVCLRNRYWDPFVLDDIFLHFEGKVPNFPTERGAKNRLSVILKFLRDNPSTTDMYNRHIPEFYRRGQNRDMLCGSCIKWSSEVPLSQILSSNYYLGELGADNIERTIQMLQETVSFKIPLLIKPVIEMRNEKSAFVSCLQSGAYKPFTRKMIDIGVPRELAITLNGRFFHDENDVNGVDLDDQYELESFVRTRLQEVFSLLPYWEQVQLDFLKSNLN